MGGGNWLVIGQEMEGRRGLGKWEVFDVGGVFLIQRIFFWGTLMLFSEQRTFL